MASSIIRIVELLVVILSYSLQDHLVFVIGPNRSRLNLGACST